MRRKSKHRNGGDEINLTPLLDVLFTILFVVMLTSAQSEQAILADSEQTKKQVTELTDKVEKLENDLKGRDAVDGTTESFVNNAVLVTMVNVVEDNNHVLRIYIGQKGTLKDSFRLGTDRTQYISEHIASIIGKIIEEARDYPVYIVFHCNTNIIYRKEEFAPIKERLELLKAENKEVFYQIVEE